MSPVETESVVGVDVQRSRLQLQRGVARMSAEWDDLLRETLGPNEAATAVAKARNAALVVSDRRLLILTGERTTLDVPFDRLRRIQFDIERNRPATLVIVPEHPSDEPQVLPIPREEYRAVADALVVIGEKIHQ
jgi:hypothetical protein